MHSIFSVALATLAVVSASPIKPRVVAELNEEAFKEAQPRDDTATRAFSATAITTSDGQCLSVEELSGDFRANLNPIEVKACDGSAGQQWDVITAGKHNDQAGNMLVVNTLTQACMNFDPRRAAGNTVIMFSCGGRADGGGAVTNSQLFPFDGSAGPLSLSPGNAAGTCLAVAGAVLDQAPCAAGSAAQTFTFGAGGAAPAPAPVPVPASSAVVAPTALPVADVSSSAAAPAPTPAAPATGGGNPTTEVPVSRAGGVLNPTAAAEANPRDETATRAFTSASIKTSSGQCLFIDPAAGDFRQNLIPVAVQDCTGAEGEKFDIITKGTHNDQANAALVVSSLTQGCLNFDPRRAAGDTVVLFSCGGRADGEGLVTESQLFGFQGGNSITLAPLNEKGATCLSPAGAKLDSARCTGGAAETFSIEA
ncbi:Ricin B-like lectin [Glarea lozoyensis ATCC 20868]|uniref:Ricin B-like lectin n=1 Tax=Glarea lozoyensis (strain ATCC 20868 / MF5171) TaxID=1116229 RepID=S3DJG4_GLAL2|nr:Ricin B-like lectin [Glarea lozoyensis ATCC 20868]EPE32181.1 Ricin B-like lectin [Glarea lozoyensis ATCC 20868]